jgi:hypothetical protein
MHRAKEINSQMTGKGKGPGQEKRGGPAKDHIRKNPTSGGKIKG